MDFSGCPDHRDQEILSGDLFLWGTAGADHHGQEGLPFNGFKVQEV
jgi:hypothetical protein